MQSTVICWMKYIAYIFPLLKYVAMAGSHSVVILFKIGTVGTVKANWLLLPTLIFYISRGQAYDGASNMQGVRNGVATQVHSEVPAVVPFHCFAHCLQLVLQETTRQCKALRDSLELVREIGKLIKLSPKKSTLFSKNLEAYEGGVTLKPLCPTRWTVRTAAFQAVLVDFIILQETMEEISDTTHDEYGQKANGISASLSKFETVFGLKLGYLIFTAAEQFSRTLQGKDTTLQEAMSAVALAKKHYTRLRIEAGRVQSVLCFLCHLCNRQI